MATKRKDYKDLIQTLRHFEPSSMSQRYAFGWSIWEAADVIEQLVKERNEKVSLSSQDKIISANELMNAIRLWDYPLKQYYGNEVEEGMFTKHIQHLINEMPSIDIK